jgi:hypothetical protein
MLPRIQRVIGTKLLQAKLDNITKLPEFEELLKKLLAELDAENFTKIAGEVREQGEYYCKYLRYDYHIRNRLIYYFYLGLQNKPKLSILDLGTGCGWFPYICRQLGHDVDSTDIENFEVFNQIIEFLEIPRKKVLRHARISPSSISVKSSTLSPASRRTFNSTIRMKSNPKNAMGGTLRNGSSF